MATPDAMPGQGNRPLGSRPKELGDTSNATPVDPRFRTGPSKMGSRMLWDDYVREMASQARIWYNPPGNLDMAAMEALQAAALRTVRSSVALTRRAIVLRVVSGDLAANRPLLGQPTPGAVVEPASGAGGPEEQVLPAVVITANNARFSGVTRFGRGSSRRSLLPDLQMDEPIASRNHFNVIYDEECDKFNIMDAGSKWGTFTKICSRTFVNCGDWIRFGNAEFIVRYCGGGCNCRKHHTHYKLHSLRIQKEHAGSKGFKGLMCPVSPGMGPPEMQRIPSCVGGPKQGGWLTESGRLSHTTAMANAGLTPDDHQDTDCEEDIPSEKPVSSDVAPVATSREEEEEAQKKPTACSAKVATAIPVPPLELEFISGPRTGERVTLCERRCTLGRGEASTIQVSDPTIANVSRIHCVFEYIGNRWHIRDNGSTNGTWRRLSCVLEPSKPMPLKSGMSILAGVHEFRVQEAEMGQWWMHSAAATLLTEMSVHRQKR
jgi:pSer/pThr/pTyr-binding forkhead associated (FHA) protein